jgi:integrase
LLKLAIDRPARLRVLAGRDANRPALSAVRREDVTLGSGAHIHCVEKGRKERGRPLTNVALRVLQAWMKEPWPIESAFLFPSLSGGRLNADAVQDFVNKHVAVARLKCPSHVKKRVTSHVLRHYLGSFDERGSIPLTEYYTNLRSTL